MTMESVFWASAATIFYVYVGYPLMLVVWARLASPASSRLRQLAEDQAEFASAGGAGSVDPWGDYAVAHDAEPPRVSIVLAVRNEAHRLRARVENLLAQDYEGELEIIVVSDGSTDNPAAALQGCPPIVHLIEIPARGKAAALNAGVAEAHHELLVFADARQTFAPDAVRQLIRPFSDPDVGGVTGELMLDAERDIPPDGDPTVADGVGMYWRYEKALRRMESAVGSTLGATGAIYALRKSLWRALPEDTLLDDVLAPMRAVLAGYRVVFEDGAKAFDYVSRDAATESRRKIRTLAGNVQILWLEPRLLLPFANPVWWQYVSHKLGRLIVPYALVSVFVSSVALASTHWIYSIALFAQTTFYLLAIYGAWLAAPALDVKHVPES
jgi:cellulose synthase/poly-beta-1,6-N-acetylglucosamine synthase-like glycosyltransferase